jgi:hypothetical protein
MVLSCNYVGKVGRSVDTLLLYFFVQLKVSVLKYILILDTEISLAV